MTRIRTPGDQARYHLYLWRQEIRASGIPLLTKEEAVRGGASFEEVLAIASSIDIAGIPDEDAMWIDRYEPGLGDGGHLTANVLLDHFIGWDSEDIFFSQSDVSSTEEVLQQAIDTPPDTPAKRPSGRKPAQWWPELAAQLAFLVHEEGNLQSAEAMIGRVQERVAASGYDEPSRPSVQKAVRRYYELLERPLVD